MPLLDMVGLVDAVGVLIVAESRGLEELVEVAVARVNRERAALLREPMLRERMMEHPATLLRLYQGVSEEEGYMGREEEEVRHMDMVGINSGGVLRACYSCGACSTGIYCSWCDYRPASR